MILRWTADGRSLIISPQLSISHSDLLVIDAVTGAVKPQVSTGAWAQEGAADPTGRFIALGLIDGTLLFLDAKDGHALAPPLRANDGEVINVPDQPRWGDISPLVATRHA